MSAALAFIDALAPANEAEGILAVNIACLNAAAGKMQARLAYHSLERGLTFASNAVAKLDRSLQSAVTNYFRLKRGGVQTIRIERLEVQSGAQAVVGNVIAGGGRGD